MQNALLIFLLFLPSSLWAKIADAPPIVFDGITYRGHGNHIQAVRIKAKVSNDRDFSVSETEESLWITTLPYNVSPDQYIEHLEKDVQWCISRVVKVNQEFVEAKNCLGDAFQLKRDSGRLLKTDFVQSRVRAAHGGKLKYSIVGKPAQK